MKAPQESPVHHDSSPFQMPIGRRIAHGIHSEVRELGNDWVVKKVIPLWQRGDWEKRWVEDYRLLRDFLRSFIPPTGFVEGKDEEDRRNLLLVQKRVDGKRLRLHSYEELSANTTALEQLNEFTMEALLMHQLAGRLPDLHGSPDLLHQYDMGATDNIIIEPTGKAWLVDVDMLGPLWSPNWIGGRLHMRQHVESVHRFRERLNLDKIEERANAPVTS